jgi:Asp-tRNA(Asn)/Glu-tRNA(Gln) amidotransferase A subunit family amidase
LAAALWLWHAQPIARALMTPLGRLTRPTLLEDRAREGTPWNAFVRKPLMNVVNDQWLAKPPLPASITWISLPAGKPFDEATVFQAAYAYEQSTAWHTQHPAL